VVGHSSTRSRRIRGILTAMVIVAVVSGAGMVEGRIGPPVRFRMNGYVGAPHEGRTEQADLKLRWKSTDIRFQVTKSLLLSGGGFASTIFDRVRPYDPNFFLRGPDEIVAPFGHAAPGTSWQIIALWRPGTRDLMVSSAHPEPASGSPQH